MSKQPIVACVNGPLRRGALAFRGPPAGCWPRGAPFSVLLAGLVALAPNSASHAGAALLARDRDEGAHGPPSVHAEELAPAGPDRGSTTPCHGYVVDHGGSAEARRP
jgi:hypothetical protein